MNAAHSDALVFFCATADLASKKIFPALRAMVKRGHTTWKVSRATKCQADCDSRGHQDLRHLLTREPIRKEAFGDR